MDPDPTSEPDAPGGGAGDAPTRDRIVALLVRAGLPGALVGAGCLLVDGDGVLRFTAASDRVSQGLDVAEELSVEGPCHLAFVTGSPALVEDLDEEDRWPRLRALLAPIAIRGIVGVPIVVDGRPVGALNVFSSQRLDGKVDVDELVAIAAEIGVVLEGALAGDPGDDGPMLSQLRLGIGNLDLLRRAAEVVARTTGLDPADGALRLRQAAAAAGLTAVDVARRAIEGDLLPDVRDLAEQADAERRRRTEVARLAFTDPLTGVANRALFLDRLDQALARATRGLGRPTVLFVDLDRYKIVNDSLGHEAGDEVLVEVARRLEAVVRPHDTVGRLGGDEFAVLCDATPDVAVGVGIARRVLRAIALPIVLGGTMTGRAGAGRDQPGARVSIGASIGVARAVGAARATEVLRDADRAMYVAKARGGQDVEVFSDDVARSSHRRMAIELALGAALLSGPPAEAHVEGLGLAYQPIVDLRGVRTLEALARWPAGPTRRSAT